MPAAGLGAPQPRGFLGRPKEQVQSPLATGSRKTSFGLASGAQTSLEGGREPLLREDAMADACGTIRGNKKALSVERVSGGGTGYASGKGLKYSPPSAAQRGFALADAVQHFACNCSSPIVALLARNRRVLQETGPDLGSA